MYSHFTSSTKIMAGQLVLISGCTRKVGSMSRCRGHPAKLNNVRNPQYKQENLFTSRVQAQPYPWRNILATLMPVNKAPQNATTSSVHPLVESHYVVTPGGPHTAPVDTKTPPAESQLMVTLEGVTSEPLDPKTPLYPKNPLEIPVGALNLWTST